MADFLPWVRDWFLDRFTAPSPAQVAAWPAIRRGDNVLLLAPTGSGKTFAAFFTAIDDLYRKAAAGDLSAGVHVVYVSPLKALGNDIEKNLLEPLEGIRSRAAAKGTELPEVRVAVRTGDTPQAERQRMIRRPPHILITTPESLYLMLGSKRMQPNFGTVGSVIVDEVHQLCSDKRGVHLAVSLERLAAMTSKPLQRIGCSATLNPLARIAAFLAGYDPDGRPRPCTIADAGQRKDLDIQVRAPLADFLEASNTALWASAYELLLEEIGAHDTTLIFANSRYKAERTALHLTESGSSANISAHHGSMSRETRLETETALKGGHLDALVATSSLELGIDIGSVDMVYQLESPKSVAAGLQRIGRAGHLLDATSCGRVLVFDRDELLEAGAILRAMKRGDVDAVDIPEGCLDVLAQQIAGAVSGAPQHVDSLYDLVRGAYPYRDLDRETFEAVVQMLAGDYSFEMSHPPLPLVLWDRITGRLSPTRSAPNISAQCVGTIPDTTDYEVVIERTNKRVGTVNADFVDDSLRRGDVFVLGSSPWRVMGVRKNRLLVQEASSATPTVPWWLGDVVSRTFEVGVAVGRLRRTIAASLDDSRLATRLQREYFFDANAANAVIHYVREQHLAAGIVPDDKRLLVETWVDELRRRNVIVHSPFGTRINRTWGIAIATHAKAELRQEWTVFAANDVLLLTRQQETVPPRFEADAPALLAAVGTATLPGLLDQSSAEAMAFGSSFGHAAACALQVLRAKHGKRVPPWIQRHRAAELHDAAGSVRTYPVVREVVREYTADKLDMPGLARILKRLEGGSIDLVFKDVESPSPFAQSVLVETTYKDRGHQMGRDRRANLLRLHRRVLEDVLTSEQMAELLDPRAIEQLELRVGHQSETTKARTSEELAQCIRDLGDIPADLDSLASICAGNPISLLRPLLKRHDVVGIELPLPDGDGIRLVAAENFRRYHDAFHPRGRRRLRLLVPRIKGKRIDGFTECAAAEVIPARWRRKQDAHGARVAIVATFLRTRGPVNRYDIMNATGWPIGSVEQCLDELVRRGDVVAGVYAKAKSAPQWIWKSNLEHIHRHTMEFLKVELAPCAPHEFVDFVTRWQHRHPDTRLSGVDGLRQVIEQLQGVDVIQAALESEVLAARMTDYSPEMLDQLIAAGEVEWRRFGVDRIQRGRIGLCLRKDANWLPLGRKVNFSALEEADLDIPEVISGVRAYFEARGHGFFDEVLAQTGFEEGQAMRALWHLVWCGEVTCDTFECVRHANFTVTLSACYDLDSTPRKILSGKVSPDRVIRQMTRRRLDPRLGRWHATERLIPSAGALPEPDIARSWARQLLARWGIVTRDVMAFECCAPSWAELTPAFKRLELLGQVNRGYFIENHQGEQYGLPEAIELLRDCRGRRGGGRDLGYQHDEPVFPITSHDPANLYAYCLDIVDGDGQVFKRSVRKGNLTIRSVLQSGQALLHRDTQLVPLTREQFERCIEALQRDGAGQAVPLSYRRWNKQPIEASPATAVFLSRGFRFDTRGELCWPPPGKPAAAKAPPFLDTYAPYYSEVTTVEYGPKWFVDHASDGIAPHADKVLQVVLPIIEGAGWQARWGHMYLHARFEGMGNFIMHIGKTVMNLRVGLKGRELTPVWRGLSFRITQADGIDGEQLTELEDALALMEEVAREKLAEA